MRERIEERLRELREELEVGRRMLAELDARRANLNGSMLRIGGAAQALEELLRDERFGGGASAEGQSGEAAEAGSLRASSEV
jgi:hypothetical protein